MRNLSSHRMYSIKKDFFKNFAKFTEKHLRRSLYFDKVAGLRPVTLSKQRPRQTYYPVSFATFLTRHEIFTEHFSETASGLITKEKTFIQI